MLRRTWYGDTFRAGKGYQARIWATRAHREKGTHAGAQGHGKTRATAMGYARAKLRAYRKGDRVEWRHE